jgi:hypothetical protein
LISVLETRKIDFRWLAARIVNIFAPGRLFKGHF